MATVCKTARNFEFDRPEIRLVAPDGARKFLGSTDDHPFITKNEVAKHAKDIRDGLWRQPQHKVILFPDGTLAAGHEYLRGIIKAGVPAKLYFEQVAKPKQRDREGVQTKLSIADPLRSSVRQTSVTLVVETITPEVAAQYLMANTSNRRLRQYRIDMYARDMAAGRWKLNDQGISFDSEGVLLNGQHRLSAVIVSGASVQMLVVRGLDNSAGTTVDLCGIRNEVDLARFLGKGDDINTDVTACSKMMRKTKRNGKETRQESLAFTITHLDAIKFAVSVAKSPESKNSVVRSVIARAYYTVNHDSLRRFAEIFATGSTEGPHESAVIPVRTLISRDSKAILHSHHLRESLSLKVQNALRAFLQGRPLSKAVECQGNLFLLPGEKD